MASVCAVSPPVVVIAQQVILKYRASNVTSYSFQLRGVDLALWSHRWCQKVLCGVKSNFWVPDNLCWLVWHLTLKLAKQLNKGLRLTSVLKPHAALDKISVIQLSYLSVANGATD